MRFKQSDNLPCCKVLSKSEPEGVDTGIAQAKQRIKREESEVINHKAWQLNSGSELNKFANTPKNNIMFTLYFIHTVYPKF